MSNSSMMSNRNKSRLDVQASKILSIICLIVLAANLRPALSSVAPVLTVIQQELHISSAGIGILTTLPVLCFGLFAPGAARLATKFTVDRVILYGLITLVTGLCIRIFFGAHGLFFGTLLAGAGIGAVMVLLPPVIKRDFPDHAGFMTGLYTMAVCLGAAFAAGVTVPIQNYVGGNWRPALVAWAVPAILSALLWYYKMRRQSSNRASQHWKVSGMYLNGLAWQVTLFMGLQSAIAFIIFGWLPSILMNRGMAPLMCGYVMSVIFACQIFTALTAPSFASRGRDQRFTSCFFLIITVAGVLGCLYGSLASIWVWAIIVGLGMGGTFSIALALIVWRSPSPEIAASLSGMVQGVGYTTAAFGPLAVGILHEWTHDWSFLGGFMVAIAIAGIISAMGAGRNTYIEVKTTMKK
jgi:CP family cyanate transporter-like MFS transporter